MGRWCSKSPKRDIYQPQVTVTEQGNIQNLSSHSACLWTRLHQKILPSASSFGANPFPLQKAVIGWQEHSSNAKGWPLVRILDIWTSPFFGRSFRSFQSLIRPFPRKKLAISGQIRATVVVMFIYTPTLQFSNLDMENPPDHSMICSITKAPFLSGDFPGPLPEATCDTQPFFGASLPSFCRSCSMFSTHLRLKNSRWCNVKILIFWVKIKFVWVQIMFVGVNPILRSVNRICFVYILFGGLNRCRFHSVAVNPRTFLGLQLPDLFAGVKNTCHPHHFLVHQNENLKIPCQNENHQHYHTLSSHPPTSSHSHCLGVSGIMATFGKKKKKNRRLLNWGILNHGKTRSNHDSSNPWCVNPGFTPLVL